jgi:hypothetical protein
MNLHDDQELLSVLAMDRSENQQRHIHRSLPPWQFAETVRIAIHRRRGLSCAAWFDKSICNSPTPLPAKKTIAFIDYGPELQFSPRKKFWRRHANYLLAIWWRITFRGTRHTPYSAD